MDIDRTTRQIAELMAKTEVLMGFLALLCARTIPDDELDALVLALRSPVSSAALDAPEEVADLANSLGVKARNELADWIDRRRT